VRIELVYTSHSDSFTALWRHPDALSASWPPSLFYLWLSMPWRVPKVRYTFRYNIKYWQPFHCVKIFTDNLVTCMTPFVSKKMVECATWPFDHYTTHKVPCHLPDYWLPVSSYILYEIDYLATLLIVFVAGCWSGEERYGRDWRSQ